MATRKFSPMRFTAATEEAAVEGALQLVGASRDEADYEVLDASEKGVTVRVKPRDLSSQGENAAPVGADEAASNPVALSAEEQIETSVEDETPEVESDEEVDEFSSEEFLSDNETEDEEDADEEIADDEFVAEETEDAEDIESDEFDEAEDEDEEFEDEEEEVTPPVSAESREQAISMARSFIERMGLDAGVNFDEREQPGTIALEIEGEDIGILIGKGGNTLQSFQYLLNLTLNNEIREGEDGVRVVVDAGSYRARRQNSLETEARSAAQRARTSGRPVRLAPMPAGERRIVHMFLQRESGISTQSEGREPQRRIVVFPAESSQPTYNRHEVRAARRGMGGYGDGPNGNSNGGRGRRGR